MYVTEAQSVLTKKKTNFRKQNFVFEESSNLLADTFSETHKALKLIHLKYQQKEACKSFFSNINYLLKFLHISLNLICQ